MSPTGNEQPLKPRIIEATGVEKPSLPQTSDDLEAITNPITSDKIATYPTDGEPTAEVPEVKVEPGNLESDLVHDGSKSEVFVSDPGEFDPSTVEPVVRNKDKAKSSETKSSGRMRGFGAAIMATAALGAGLFGAAHNGEDNSRVNATEGDNTTQVDTDKRYTNAISQANDVMRGQVPIEAQAQDPAQPEESNSGQGEQSGNTDSNTSDFQVSEMFNDDSVDQESTPSNVESGVPDNHERTIVGPEAYPGEVSVNRSFDLAKYLMDTSAPTIDQFEDGTGAYVYQHESGAIVMINGKMNQGELARDRNLPLDGLTITLNLPDGRSVTVTYEEGHEKAITYALQDGTRYSTEDGNYMSDVVVDAQKASDFGAQISAEADSLIRANNK